MLYLRALISLATVLVGIAILARMLAEVRGAGFMILPGVVLGAAMIALGAHRLSLILRARSMTR